MGVDLGQSQDYTAIGILERTAVDTGRTKELVQHRSTVRSSSTYGSGGSTRGRWSTPGRTKVEVAVTENHYAARHLERLATGTPYPAQVKRVRELYDRLTAQEGKPPLMVVDWTGVGRPVVDMLREAEMYPAAVFITGGDAVHQDGKEYRVPKRDLVGSVQVLLQTERLKIASSLKEAATLTAELLAFKVNINAKGHDCYGNDVGDWRENPHDDLVLAVALACWLGENQRTVIYGVPPSLSFRGSRYSGRR